VNWPKLEAGNIINRVRDYSDAGKRLIDALHRRPNEIPTRRSSNSQTAQEVAAGDVSGQIVAVDFASWVSGGDQRQSLTRNLRGRLVEREARPSEAVCVCSTAVRC